MKGITSRDVARLAKVSQSTVSLVLSDNKKASISEETRRKVIESAQKLGYVYKGSELSKRRNTNKRKNIIGVVVPNLVYPYYPRLLDSIEKNLISNNYNMMVCNVDTESSEDYYVELFKNKSIDGVIFAFTPNTDKLINAVDGNIPAVLLGEKDDNINFDTISINSLAAGELLVEHLYSLGHRSIAVLSGKSDTESRAARRRLEGIRSKMHELKLEKNLIFLFNENYKDTTNFFWESVRSGYDLTNKILKDYKNTTVIIGVDDIICLGILEALKDSGLSVPDDMAVCSFDDTYISRITSPKLTTIDPNTHISVRFAIDLLIERINNPNKSRRLYKTEAEPHLEIRGSTNKDKIS